MVIKWKWQNKMYIFLIMAKQHSTFLKDFEQLHSEICVAFCISWEFTISTLCLNVFKIISSAEQNINSLQKGKHLKFSITFICLYLNYTFGFLATLWKVTKLFHRLNGPEICTADLSSSGSNWKQTYNWIYSIYKSALFLYCKSLPAFFTAIGEARKRGKRPFTI